MASFKLNDEALDDIEIIFEYGIDAHGLEAASTYVEGLKSSFAEIARSPLQNPAVSEIRAGYRRCVYRRHSIYYRVSEGMVEIMAVIGQQDIKARF